MVLLISVTIMIAASVGTGILLTALCWKLLMRAMLEKNADHHKMEAEAIVLSFYQTGLFINELPQIKMQMQVQPERGRNFVAEIQQLIPLAQLEMIHEGSRVIVLYNPGNHKEISLLRAA